MPVEESRSQFVTGIERAVRHWLAFWREHDHRPEERTVARGHALRALNWCGASGNSLDLAIDLAMAMHDEMWLRGQWQEWAGTLRQLLIRANPAATPDRLFTLRGALGSVYWRLHRLEESIALLGENHRRTVEIGDCRQQADYAIGLAEAYLNADAPDQALRYAEEAATLAATLGLSWQQVDGLIDGARALTALGDLAEAERRLHEAAGLAEARKLSRYQAKAQLFLGHVLSRGDRWQEALTHYQAALDLSASYGDKGGCAVVQTHMGRALLELGRLEEASRLLQDALRGHRYHGNQPAEQATLQRLQEVAAQRAAQTDYQGLPVLGRTGSPFPREKPTA